MKKSLCFFCLGLLLSFFSVVVAWSQEVKTKNARSWELGGRIQLQYLHIPDIDGDAGVTNNGFRIRRGRFEAAGQLTDWVQTKFQIEVRDNSPRLKDAEGKIKLGNSFFVRLGQFKVPVWREELRSSGKLLLIERSEVAEFLLDLNLSARQIGVEFGGTATNNIQWAVNLSNGSGEGGREDAGQNKQTFINNGKLITGRINVPVGEKVHIALSGAANRAGMDTGIADNSGTIYTIAPDFGVYLPAGANGQFDLEGGLAIGKISSDFLNTTEDREFTLFDITGRWTGKMQETREELGGLNALEFAAGITFIEPNSNVDDNETLFIRFGPAFYFGKNTRLQLNGEVESPAAEGADSILKFRAQTTFNF